MSQYTFDCHVCDAHLETDEISEVVTFGNAHKDCKFEDEA